MPRPDPVPQRPPARPPERKPERRVANAHAWARYYRIMRWMTLLAIGCVVLTLVYFRKGGAPVPINMVIAGSVGVFLTVMVGTGLMSLVFLSAGSGHDDAVIDPFEDD